MVRLLALEAMNFKRLSLQNPLNFSDGITLIWAKMRVASRPYSTPYSSRYSLVQ